MRKEFRLAAPLAAACIVGTIPARADVVISGDATQNMSCSAGVCAPTATHAVLNVTDLENLLASESVTVTTKGSGVQAKNIDTHAVLTWNSGNQLTLDAYDSINVHRLIAVEGSAALTIVTENGNLQFGRRPHITFANLSSGLTINGVSYELENSITSLATAIAANPSGSFALLNDYDASADGTYLSSPIQTTFTGTLEGLGNAISHLSIDSGDYNVGLFSYVAHGGTVANLRLRHVHVTGTGTLVGAVTGQMQGTLFDNVVSGRVASSNKSSVGGLAGDLLGGSVIASHSSARAIGKAQYSVVGSLVGESGTITESYATGDAVGGDGSCVGGLIGTGQAIEKSFATGAARGVSSSVNTAVGGLAGCPDGTISNSYATGSASAKVLQGGHADVGGLVGDMVGTISDSYSTGSVRGPAGSDLGGLCGFVQQNGSESFTDTYWDTDTSGITNPSQGCGNLDWPGITGLTTEQLQSGLPKGFRHQTWREKTSINNGFPYLIANPPPQ